MNNRQRWVAAAVSVSIATVCVTVSLLGNSRPRKSPARAAAPTAAAPVERTEVKSKHAEWAENPFIVDRRGYAQAEVRTGPVLSGILWDPANPVAVINEQLVSVGDQVDDWRVTEITQERVVLSDGVTSQTLTVQ